MSKALANKGNHTFYFLLFTFDLPHSRIIILVIKY